MKIAVERKSSVLASNAVHHRVDSWTAIVTLVVILLANFMKNAAWLDPVGGLLISLLVVKAGAQNTMSALGELVDQTIDDDVKKSVRKHVNKALEMVTEGHEVEIRDVSGIKSGQNYLLDLELVVPGAWTVEDVRDVEEGVRQQIGSHVRGAKRVRVRFVSREALAKMPEFDEFVSGEVSPEVVELEAKSEDEHDHEHDHDHDHDDDHDHDHAGHDHGHASGKSNGKGNVNKRR